MSFLFGGDAPKPPRAMPAAPDMSGELSQSQMETARRRAAMADGRSKMLIVPQAANNNAAPSRQKMLLGQ